MKTLAPTAVALAILLGLGLSQAPAGAQEDPPPAGDVDARVEALEAEVAALRKELSGQSALIDETIQYLAGTKSRGKALEQSFTAAEQAGFTAGINFRSREILLAGFRAYLEDEASDLPGTKKKAAEE